MLLEMRLRALGVIADAVLELGPGLTVVTGETGAGKTMVVTGLGLLMGGRADPGAVREGQRTASVEGRLLVDPAGPVAARAAEAGAELDDGDVLIVSRTVSAEGRGRAHLGGRSVPAGLLAELSESLVTVHGQTDQLRLRAPARQREALDRFAGAELAELLAEYRATWQRLRHVEARLDEIVVRARERAQEAEILRLGLAEVERVQPQPAEDVALRAEADRLGHAEELRAAAENAHLALTGDPDGPGSPDVTALVAQARRALEQVGGTTRRSRRSPPGSARSGTWWPTSRPSAPRTRPPSRPTPPGWPQSRSGVRPCRPWRVCTAATSAACWPGPRRPLPACSSSTATRTARRGCAPSATSCAGGSRSRPPTSRGGASRRRPTWRSRCRPSSASSPCPTPASWSRCAAGRTRQACPSTWARGRSRSPQAPTGSTRSSSSWCRTRGRPPARSRGAPPAASCRGSCSASRWSSGPPTRCRRSSSTRSTRVSGARRRSGSGAAWHGWRATSQVLVVTHLPQVAAYADRHLIVVKSSDGEVTVSGVSTLDDEGRVRELARMLAGLEDSGTARAHARELLASAERERALAKAPARRRVRPSAW